MGDRHNSLCFEQKHRLLGVAVDTAKPEEWKLTANIETSTHPPEGVWGDEGNSSFFLRVKTCIIMQICVMLFDHLSNSFMASAFALSAISI